MKSVPIREARRLSEVYAERKEQIARYVPADVQAANARVVRELAESGIADGVLKTGGKAPQFELSDHNRNLVRSSGLLERSRLILCFFRGRWCPFCVGQLEAWDAVYPQLRESGADLLAISPQTPHQSYLMADQHRLRFLLLSDAGNQVAKRFGLVYRVPEYQREIHQRAFINLPLANGDPSWELPIPATFIVDRSSTILYSAANPDYSERPEPRAVLDFLQLLPR